MNSTAIACTTIICVTIAGTALLSAGPLDPPAGPVSSTYKTLSEVEPRVPIGATTTPGDGDSVFKITQSGSYYLAGNILGAAGKHGIEIDADDVTLDLRGFAMVGVPGSLDGVNIVPPRSGVSVRDGALRGWGESGVSAVGGPNARNCLFENLRLGGNATSGFFYALDMGAGSNAVNCVANGNASGGFRGNDGCNLLGCTATNNGGDGMINGAGTVRDCLARGNAVDGIRVAVGIVTGCTATANGDAGITISFGAIAQDNVCNANEWGLYAYGDGCRVDGNNLYQNAIGLEVVSEGNVIVRNTFRANTVTDTIVPGNDVGPFGSAATSTSPWANFVY